MPRFRFGNIAVIMQPPQPVEIIRIPDECLEVLKSLDEETLDKCVRAMRNGVPGEPTSGEKGVLRRIANPLGIEDIIALSWAGPFKEQG